MLAPGDGSKIGTGTVGRERRRGNARAAAASAAGCDRRRFEERPARLVFLRHHGDGQ